jgi:hypothetical protein
MTGMKQRRGPNMTDTEPETDAEMVQYMEDHMHELHPAERLVVLLKLQGWKFEQLEKELGINDG